jgi:phosphomannomutase
MLEAAAAAGFARAGVDVELLGVVPTPPSRTSAPPAAPTSA